MSWKLFDRENFESGLFWFLVEEPVVDIDTDDYGQTTGVYTGEISKKTVLAIVEQDDDGYPEFFPVDSVNFGSVSEVDVVTHFAEVKAPIFL